MTLLNKIATVIGLVFEIAAALAMSVMCGAFYLAIVYMMFVSSEHLMFTVGMTFKILLFVLFNLLIIIGFYMNYKELKGKGYIRGGKEI
jgi:hypothetical protein